MSDHIAALRAFAEAQILAGQKLLASVAEMEDDNTEEPAAAPKRGPGRPRKAAAPAASEKTPPRKVAKPAPEPEPEEDDEPEDADAARRAELEEMKITALRALALKRGFKEEGVRSASKADLIDAIVDDEKEDGSDDDGDDDEDSEDVTYTRDELVAMGVRKAKALAIERGISAADLKGLKVDDVADLILSEGGGADDEDEDSDGDEDDYYTREQLEKMSLAELKAIGRQYEQDYPNWKMPRNIAKPALIDLLLEEDDDE